jgi:Xaa-Pro aminopeptidase
MTPTDNVEKEHLEVAVHLERRRHEVASLWDLTEEAVVIGAGEPIPVPGRGDRTYPFRAHSEYYYLTDRERPGGALVFDPTEGWIDFVAPVTRDERLWEGATGDHDGVDVSELGRWLKGREGQAMACLGSAVGNVASDDRLAARLRQALNTVRRPKDELELARMRVTVNAVIPAKTSPTAPTLAPNSSPSPAS